MDSAPPLPVPPPPTVVLEDASPNPTATPAPLPTSTGHGVTVHRIYSTIDKTKPGHKATLKKQSTSKFNIIALEDLDRSAFIREWLKVWDLDTEYSPGVHCGPPFKMWWTGSAGGKKGITIENDREYMVAIDAIRKKPKTCQVNVEFDLDSMDGYRIQQKRPLLLNDTEDAPELLYGTKVPRLDNFTEQDQLHGKIILELKQKWPCERHHGEHGEAGFCYVDPAGNHLGLNHRKLAMWAAAIAAHDATKHEPPNNVSFDTLRDGRLTVSKPRGCIGPRRARASTPPPDPTSALMAALIAHLIPKPAAPIIEAPVPTTPRKETAPTTPTPISPIPSRSSELHACLADFSKVEDVDLLHSEAVLTELDLTPDIIPDVPIPRLIQVTGAVEGQLWKLQAFCRSWTARLAEKRSLLR